MKRFWDKVDRRGSDQCWRWLAGKRDRFGYGSFRFQGKDRLAHHVAYELLVGPIPKPKINTYHGTVLRHTCDNPWCVNPKHLVPGTQRENMQDAGCKGRLGKFKPTGERNPMCRFSDTQIVEMKHLRASGMTQQAIAASFGTTQPVISRILSGQRRSA